MGDLPKQLRDVAVYLAPLGSHSGATRWEAAELMREAADALAAQQDGVREGFTLVPNAALEWLLGSGPDADGKWFGECEDEVTAMPRKQTPRYWWRSKFRKVAGLEQKRGNQTDYQELADRVARGKSRPPP